MNTPGAGDRGGGEHGGPGGPAAVWERDPGVQPERTWLAWRRTTLAGAAVPVLAVRHAVVVRPSAWAAVAAACAALAWLGLLVLAQRRIRLMTASPPPVMSRTTALLTTVCTLALTACGALLIR